jgi:hypothetical protein
MAVNTTHITHLEGSLASNISRFLYFSTLTCLWLTPVILAIWKTELKRMVV